LVPGGPAQQGEELQPGDRIVAVAQGSEPPVDVVDERIDKVVKQIRGPKGTEVRLTVIPVDAPDPSHTRVIHITRDQVILAADDAESRVIEVPGQDGQGIKLGLIDIPSFYQDFQARRGGDPEYKSTTRDVKQLLTELKAEEVSGIILDVRRNGGGSLNEAVELTGLFIPQGPVVQIGDRSGRTEAMYDPDPAVVYEGPLMVLTSPLSASASEILAGAIQDYDRGLVVGSASTHGKGTVQNVIDLDPVLRRFVRYPTSDDLAGAVKVTTHKFYRVSGASTQLRGVQADVVLPSPYDGLELLEGDLDYVLGWDRVAPLTYREIDNLEPTAERLQALSAERVANDPSFTELMEAIAKRREADGIVSLALETRRKELESFPQPASDDEEDQRNDDIILDEATRIMGDWLTSKVTQAQPG
ncbi:MAG: carboxy terminal-processing peptidase, partial [Deltaproteobacteria bacterium]|nr:carboxy terminal-processing peptidase [Deltaproteobacteria bacterium]